MLATLTVLIFFLFCKSSIAQAKTWGSIQQDRKSCIVLGIPRGGVITAYYIARKLGCQFDILISRKLCAPGNEELAIGAITEYGAVYLNDKLIKELDITSDYIEEEKFKERMIALPRVLAYTNIFIKFFKAPEFVIEKRPQKVYQWRKNNYLLVIGMPGEVFVLKNYFRHDGCTGTPAANNNNWFMKIFFVAFFCHQDIFELI